MASSVSRPSANSSLERVDLDSVEVESHDLASVQVADYFSHEGLEYLPLMILSFWFGPVYDGATITPSAYDLWFGKSEETDAKIANLFKSLLVSAAEGEFDHWCKTPWGTLALVILLDQFPRNIYRNNKESFKYDWKAQYEVRLALQRHQDDALTDLEKVWFYLVLTHTEDLHAQKQCVALANEKLVNMPEMFRKMWNTIFEKHLTVIERFGRFPHRNKFQLRESTPEEAEFLDDPTFRFDLPVVLIVDPVTGEAKFIFKTGAEDHDSTTRTVLERTDTTDLVLGQDVRVQPIHRDVRGSMVMYCTAKFLSNMARRRAPSSLPLTDHSVMEASAQPSEPAQPSEALPATTRRLPDDHEPRTAPEVGTGTRRRQLYPSLTQVWRERGISTASA